MLELLQETPERLTRGWVNAEPNKSQLNRLLADTLTIGREYRVW